MLILPMLTSVQCVDPHHSVSRKNEPDRPLDLRPAEYFESFDLIQDIPLGIHQGELPFFIGTMT